MVVLDRLPSIIGEHGGKAGTYITDQSTKEFTTTRHLLKFNDI